jgi:5-(aminomethyl)-3-furanmethanol phosphate kinase
MSIDSCTVVKVGGSLFDLPDLRQRLRGWLAQLDAARVLLVPGGGATADAIRAIDGVHRLGEEAAHWLAIQALSVNARLLRELLPDASLEILDPLPFFQADEENPDHLPHLWEVTSDSLAVRAATLVDARELILLKSVSWEGNDWAAASRVGVVDGYFARAVCAAHSSLRIRIINLREAASVTRTQEV